MAGKSAWELFQLGGIFMWPLLALSVLALAVALDRLIAFIGSWESFDRFIRAIRPAAVNGDWAEVQRIARGGRPMQWMTRLYIMYRSLPTAARDEILKREGSLLLERLERRLRWLGIVGQLAPMLGLAGTVLGLVEAFAQVEQQGGTVEPSHLAAGIWQALITTVAGLAIAIPALMAFHWFQGHVDAVAARLGQLVSYLDEWSGRISDETESHSDAANTALGG